MTEIAIHRTRTPALPAPPTDARPLGGRLGLDVPRDVWPTAPELKRLEACGYGWVQLHAPPVAMLADPLCVQRHGDCLRAVLASARRRWGWRSTSVTPTSRRSSRASRCSTC